MPTDFAPFESAPNFTFFHTRLWINTLLGAFPRWRDASRLIRLADGRNVLLPLLQTDVVGRWRWLDAMPFGFYGGPVVTEGSLGREQMGHIVREASSGAGWLAINLDPASSLAAAGNIPSGATSISTHILTLSGEVEEGFTKTARYDMRRASREGVTARKGKGEADFMAYYGLTKRAIQRWHMAAPPFPAPLYEALAVMPSDRVSLWLAVFEGKPIGGLINIFYKPGCVLHWASALDPDYTSLNPTKLLQREAIREALEQGATIYNMGPSEGFDGRLLDGVRRSKEALGARPYDYAIAIVAQPWAMRARAVRNRLMRQK